VEPPGVALRAYLTTAAFAPERSAAAAEEIQDLPSAGPFSYEVTDEVELLDKTFAALSNTASHGEAAKHLIFKDLAFWSNA